jgi:putative transposase
VKPAPADLDFALVASIDLGVNTLAAVTSNKPGFQPLLINGRPLKSVNQFYNKRKAELQSRLPTGQKSSARIERLTTKRNLRVKHYLHVTSRRIIDHLVAEGIGALVIGKNEGWKQKVNIGRQNNQTFMSIPHGQFIQMLSYKAELVGIHVILQEESYTSRTSFLDSETPQKHEQYAGRRVARGLFQTGDGRLINADVNAGYQILVKAIPNAFAGHGIEAVVVQPVGLPTN